MDDYLNHSIEWFKVITKTEFLRIRNDAIKHCEELKVEILKDKCHTGLTHPLHPLYTRYNEIVNYYTSIHGMFASNEMEKKLIRIELLKKKRIEDEIKEDMCLKPWRDPDSLFCDTEFLEKPVEEGGFGLKNVRIGDECKK